MAYGVIFDMDGVLVDSYRPHFESWRLVAAETGLDMTEPQFATTFGRTSREIIAHFWGEGLKTDAEIAAIDNRKEALYRQLIQGNFPAMDGARELLSALHDAGFKLAIGSSGPPENVQVVLNALGCPQFFSATVTGMDVQRGKPDPQVFLLAAQRLGLPADRCAVVEDAIAGVRAARAAGMVALAITGTTTRENLAPLADRVIDSLPELTPPAIAALIDANAATR